MELSKKTLLGYAVLVLCLLSLEASVVAVQALQTTIPNFQLSAIRYIGGFAVSAIWLLIRKKGLHVEIESYVPLIMLSVVSFVYNVLYFYAVAILPLSHAEALMVSSRMICFVIFASMARQVSLNIFTAVSMIGCTLGVILIVQPWKSYNQGFIPSFVNGSILVHSNVTEAGMFSASSIVLTGYLCVIASGAVDALYFYVSAFQLQSVNPAVQCFITACFCVPGSLLVSFYTEKPFIQMTVSDVVLAAIHSIGTGMYLTTLNGSFQLIDSVQVTIFLNFNAILILIPQYTFLGQHLYGRRNVAEVLGCIAIFCFVSLSSLFSNCPAHVDLGS